MALEEKEGVRRSYHLPALAGSIDQFYASQDFPLKPFPLGLPRRNEKESFGQGGERTEDFRMRPSWMDQLRRAKRQPKDIIRIGRMRVVMREFRTPCKTGSDSGDLAASRVLPGGFPGVDRSPAHPAENLATEAAADWQASEYQTIH